MRFCIIDALEGPLVQFGTYTVLNCIIAARVAAVMQFGTGAERQPRARRSPPR